MWLADGKNIRKMSSIYVYVYVKIYIWKVKKKARVKSKPLCKLPEMLKSRSAGTWVCAWVHIAVCMCLPSVAVICSSLRQSGRSAAVPPFSGWLPYITERLMRPDRAGVMFGGSQRQVLRASCWAQWIMSRGCYSVIKENYTMIPSSCSGTSLLTGLKY